MKDEMIPAARDTLPPETGEDFKHHSTMPPFASADSVQELKDKFIELNGLLGEVKTLLATVTNRVASFSNDIKRISLRQNKLAGRVAVLDGEEEGELDEHFANGS